MISFCLLNEGVLVPLFNDPFESAVWKGLPNPRDFKDPQSYRNALLAHKSLLNDTYAQVRGAENRHSGPGDSWWSWLPGSNESGAESQLKQIDRDLRKLDTDEKYFDSWKHGGSEPWHPVASTIDWMSDHPVLTIGGASALGYGLYKAKQAYDRKKQQEQNGFNAFSNPYGGN